MPLTLFSEAHLLEHKYRRKLSTCKWSYISRHLICSHLCAYPQGLPAFFYVLKVLIQPIDQVLLLKLGVKCCQWVLGFWWKCSTGVSRRKLASANRFWRKCSAGRSRQNRTSSGSSQGRAANRFFWGGWSWWFWQDLLWWSRGSKSLASCD